MTLGIDIGKHKHNATLLDDQGKMGILQALVIHRFPIWSGMTSFRWLRIPDQFVNEEV